MATATRPVDTAHSKQMASIRRANAIAANGEDLLQVSKRVVEWEAAGFFRGGRTVRIARAAVARIAAAEAGARA